MRLTLTLTEAAAIQIALLQQERSEQSSTLINDLLRLGLRQIEREQVEQNATSDKDDPIVLSVEHA